MLRDHLWVSTGDRIAQLARWIERRPPWLRPAFFGVGLLLAFVVARGGLILLPILFVVLLVKDPRLLFHQALPVFFFYLPVAGFFGGLLYGVSAPVLKHLGRAGRVVQYILGASVYFIVLVFFISPLLDSSKSPPLSSRGDWYFIGIMGVGVGLILGLSAMSNKGTDDPGEGAA